MTDTTVCSCGNWFGNHDPDCVVATTIHAIWTATFSDAKAWSPAEWNRAIEAILVDNAHRVAVALGDGADLPVRWICEQGPDNTFYFRPESASARALVASTGTETDDAQ